MIISIQQPEFFPWLGYFDKARQVDKIVFLDNVQFKKRYFENRNKVRTPEGWCWLRAPVLVKGRYDQLINDVEIDNAQNWQKSLVATIRHSYAKADFWSDGGEELCDLVSAHPYEKLVDFNIAVIDFLLRKFKLERPTLKASSLGVKSHGSQLILDICKAVGADCYLSGRDGAQYLEENAFSDAKIEVVYQDFTHPTYTQHHGGEFVPAMSAIDLLFNVGAAESADMISAMAREATTTISIE